ncbi:MAG TPA: aldo/keto reductase [bacterium]|jgi:aryl-alcohol dehydrogenase-like predicted oxidoreductase
MRYKLLGRSGLRVSELSLGTMTFGEDWGWGASEVESRRMFDAYLEAGGNFVDTAINYTNGTSEKYVGKFIAPIRDQIVLATKYTLCTRPGDPNASGNHRKNLMQSLHQSLRQLNTDYIDLYWVHIYDFMTPVEEIVRALDDAVRSGKILYVGISDTPAWVVSRAMTLAELRGWTPFTALQIEYSLVERTVERELLPMARALDLAITPWGVLGSGMLSGKYAKRDARGRIKDRTEAGKLKARNMQIAEAVGQVAREIGKTPSQVAINWVRQQPGVMIPILGARTLEQLKDNLGALDFSLTPELLKKLGEASAVEMGFPHDFAASPFINNIVYSGKFGEIDNHRKL